MKIWAPLWFGPQAAAHGRHGSAPALIFGSASIWDMGSSELFFENFIKIQIESFQKFKKKYGNVTNDLSYLCTKFQSEIHCILSSVKITKL
jgi:hypothetical protein